MNAGAVARSYGTRFGLLAGLFALVQAIISTLAAWGNGDSLTIVHGAVDSINNNGGLITNPLPAVGPVATILATTCSANIITGIISLVFAYQAGKLTAFVLGRKEGGASAGFWTMLISGLIWMLGSLVLTLLVRADGTATGVFTSAMAGGNLGTELVGLLGQELFLSLIGLGMGALLGNIGAARAAVQSPTQPMPGMPGVPAAAYPYPYPYASIAPAPYTGTPPAPQGWPAYPPPSQQPQPSQPPQSPQQPPSETPQ